jgi:hypothetical protein
MLGSNQRPLRCQFGVGGIWGVARVFSACVTRPYNEAGVYGSLGESNLDGSRNGSTGDADIYYHL